MLGRLYGRVGRMLPGAKQQAFNAGKQAFIAAPRGAKKAAGQAAMRSSYVAAGKTPTRAAGAAVALGGVGMYKNRDGSRGGYRPPSTRTARGSGRYA